MNERYRMVAGKMAWNDIAAFPITFAALASLVSRLKGNESGAGIQRGLEIV